MLGLLPAPEIPEKIAKELASELPELLGRHIDDRVSWEVRVVCDPLTGGEADAPLILDEGHQRMLQEGWDYAICLTDLPVNRGGQIVIADASSARGVGKISLPPLGVTLLRRRVREATLQLMSEMYRGSSESDRDREGKGQEADAGEARLRGQGSRQLIGRRLTERLAPIQRITPADEETDIDVRFVAPKVRGHLRLLAGMVLANRPWRLFYTMKGTLTGAFATGAYAMIFTTIWIMSDLFSGARLSAFMILAMVGMVVWLIVAHDLWERPADRGSRYLAALYNGVTVLTLSVAMLLSYAVLFVLFLAAAGLFVPVGLFQSTVGHPVGLSDYLALTWLTASLATIAGALGSSLEDEETVRQATYGYRQRLRTEQSEGGSDTQ